MVLLELEAMAILQTANNSKRFAKRFLRWILVLGGNL